MARTIGQDDRKAGGAGRSALATAAAVVAAAGAAAALANAAAARIAERRNPPTGRFVEAAGARLHVQGRGVGPAVVLLHGNLMTADDWLLSGVAERLAADRRRVLAFDRPGYGHSERPGGADWTPEAQADAIAEAMALSGVDRAVVVGHSHGAIVAMALAQRHPDAVAGLVLAGGYWFPTARLDSALVAPAAMPAIGPLLRWTLAPLFGRATMPAALKGMFAPRPVPERFSRGFSRAMAVRPSQIRAEAEDGAGMVDAARRLAPGYGRVGAPTVILAGTEDRVVDPDAQSRRLAAAMPDARLRLIPGAGHMVHHAAPEELAAAVAAVAAKSHGARPVAERVPRERPAPLVIG
jgi:pimeloyl-ACP methyl ester carboxylesterase